MEQGMLTRTALDQNLSPGPADLDSAGKSIEHVRIVW